MNFTQHGPQPTHNKGHILDLAITHILPANISLVVMQQDIPDQTVKKLSLTTEVVAIFIDLLGDAPAEILPSRCVFFSSFFCRFFKTVNQHQPLAHSCPSKFDKISVAAPA